MQNVAYPPTLMVPFQSLLISLGASPVSDLIMAFVASEEEDDEDENPEAEVEVNEEDDGRTIELIPNQDILIHKPQVRFPDNLKLKCSDNRI